ncbi:MAG: 23S rRNA (guanosine(2251)-2'-O)-methyltransferase RlmB [Planctomycetaceae bacterium]|nr:23S rRNA (guanosine(2251)-2'-O)-methyltransferase RlmB [Planctomycetaceae bacterium]
MSSSRPPKKFAASHQRSWLWGHHAVLETVRAGRWPVMELFADRTLNRDVLKQVTELAGRHGIRLELVDAKRLEQLSNQPDHQGLLARMGEFPCKGLPELHEIIGQTDQHQTKAFSAKGKKAKSGNLPKLFVVCDRLQDAHNFGAILRCCDAVKADGVIVGERSQVAITPHVARASSGAVNHLEIYRVASLSQLLEQMKEAGTSIVAASEKSKTLHWDTELKGDVALVIGSEATGIAPELLERCTLQVAIPMLGGVSSLNAAVAAGILMYECRRQQTHE